MIINFLMRVGSGAGAYIVSTTETQGSFDRVNRDGYEKEWST